MALATLPAAAILTALAAGTGAVTAAYVSTASVAEPIQTAALSTEKPVAVKSCAEQTWPYIEQRCLAGRATDEKAVRFVSAQPTEPVKQLNTTPLTPAAPEAGKLVSRDTVLRAPNYYNAIPDNLASDQPKARKQARKQRTERAAQYRLPDARYDNRPLVVVRPLSASRY